MDGWVVQCEEIFHYVHDGRCVCVLRDGGWTMTRAAFQTTTIPSSCVDGNWSCLFTNTKFFPTPNWSCLRNTRLLSLALRATRIGHRWSVIVDGCRSDTASTRIEYIYFEFMDNLLGWCQTKIDKWAWDKRARSWCFLPFAISHAQLLCIQCLTCRWLRSFSRFLARVRRSFTICDPFFLPLRRRRRSDEAAEATAAAAADGFCVWNFVNF